MAADRVDPAKLRIELSHVARRVVPIMAQDARAARRIADLLADCVAIADKAARAQGQGKSEWHGEGRSLAAPGADPQW